MPIDITGADDYFQVGAHTKSAIWAGFSQDQRTAGIADARRQVARLLSRSGFTLDEVTTAETDFPRHDLAVYEQACYILQMSPTLPNGEQSGPKFAMPGSPPAASLAPPPQMRLCLEALYWMVDSGDVTLARG